MVLAAGFQPQAHGELKFIIYTSHIKYYSFSTKPKAQKEPKIQFEIQKNSKKLKVQSRQVLNESSYC